MQDSSEQPQSPIPYYAWLRLGALVAAAAIVLLLLSKVLLVIFASILAAIALCSLARPITKYARIPHALAVVVATVLVVTAIGWPLMTFGSRLWAQFDEIAMDIPKATASIQQAIEAHPSALFIEKIAGDIDLGKMAAPVATHLTTIISSVGAVMAYTTLLLFGGVYFAINPEFYLNGFMYFISPNYKDRVRKFVDQAGSSLRVWLSTQLLVVVMNGVFVGIGLAAFGVDGAAALAMLAGLLSFIPYVGTIVAMVIGGLAALPQGHNFAFYTLMVLGAATIVEGYFITPYIQSKTLSLPPVILLFAIFAFGVLFGTLGVVLAAPLTVVLIAAVNTFYKPETVEAASVAPPVR